MLSIAMAAALAAEFLSQNYRFRKNILSGKVEYMEIGGNENYRVFTKESLNTLSHRSKIEEIGCGKADLEEIIFSENTPVFNPIQEYVDNLPTWDGTDRVTPLWQRLGSLTGEQLEYLHIWHRSCMAHWLQMDELHGNETVPVLIGWQGAHKTTFLKQLLPASLRGYFMDHINLSNKFDKDMALSNNLLVNLDELESIRPSQQASLKQLLSKSRVNGRPIYGAAQEDKARFASFTATTNDPHPLSDATGSRRFICVSIPEGFIIDTDTQIDYDQLYAQLKYEVMVANRRYWFTTEQNARIQELNLSYQKTEDLEQMITTCFRKPKMGEKAEKYTTQQIMSAICKQYPKFQCNHATSVSLGISLRNMGYACNRSHTSRVYKMIQKRIA